MRLLLCIAVMRVKMLIGYFNEGLRSGVFFVFCILIISAVLEHKSSKRLVQKYIIFGILAVAAAVAYEFLHLGIENLVADYEAARGGEVTWFGNIMLSLSNLVQNMIPGVAVLLAALSLYKEKWEEKVFVTLLVLLMETIVLNVFCEITNLPFSAGIAEESHLYPPEWIRIGIEVLWLGVSAALFRMFLKNALLDTLNKIKGEVGKFLKLPIASYVIFLAVLAVIDLLEDTSDLSVYETNMNLLYDKLTDLGFSCVRPGGTFYMFPKALEEDANAFCMKAREYDLLLVPGDTFGCPGYFRISYCVETEKVKRSLPAFEKLAHAYQKSVGYEI